MVNFVECGRFEFIRRTKEKKLYCFGAGKYLDEFIKGDYGIPIKGIIDNYRYMDNGVKTIGDTAFKIISVDMFRKIYDRDCAVLITCSAFDEIMEQLDSIREFDGMDCYIELFVRNETEHVEIAAEQTGGGNIIPKKIHYCWFGGGEMPYEYRKNIESWKRHCPDYEVVRWDETNYDIHKNKYISQAYENKKWAFVSDFARVDILYKEGGLYFDTDVELVKPFDEFLKWRMFCGFERPEVVAWGLGFGAVRGERILRDVLDVYEDMVFVNGDGTFNMTTCPVIQSDILKKHGFLMNGQFQVKDGAAVYPKEYFAPLGYIRGFGRITESTHSIHHYSASWTDSGQMSDRTKMEGKIARVRERRGVVLHQSRHGGNRRFQVWECLEDLGTAGGKAPGDVKRIMEGLGYPAIDIHPYKGEEGTADWDWSHRRLESEWKDCYETIPEDAVLFLQYPSHQLQEERDKTLLMLKNRKHVRIIAMVHDVESLRAVCQDSRRRAEFDFMLETADVIIVHNDCMLRYFSELGFSERRMVSIGLFDYLCEEKNSGRKYFDKSVTIAGNLGSDKSPYIRDLCKLAPLKVHLYGPNYECSMADAGGNIEYHGSFPSGRIPGVIKGGFGLVWDGESVETCAGVTGNYLRFNNPHKLSLYLAAGLPVIIWKEAAEASFVETHGVGFAVESLFEIREILEWMDEAGYERYLQAVRKVSAMLTGGEYTKIAIHKAEEILGECAG